MNLSGIVVAAITPMSDDGTSLAGEVVFDTYYRFLLDRGVNGLFLCGTTGEGMVSSLAERKIIAKRAVSYVAHAVPVLIHVGSNSTAEAIELAQHSATIGADGVGVVTPYFYTYDHSALAHHFRSVANAVPNLPVYLYNLPSYTHNNITPELLAELLHTCPNVVGIKHSDADIVCLQEYRRIAGQDFCLLSGDDSIEFAALSLGANGCISGKASAFPELPTNLYRAFKAGNLTESQLMQTNLNTLATVIDIGVGIGLAYFKACLRYRGLNVGGMRLPQRYLNTEEETALHKGLGELQRQGILDTLISLK